MMIGSNRSGKILPKVCFLIRTTNHGVGGHTWDMRTVVEAMKGRFECIIIEIGLARSPVIQSMEVRSYFVRFIGLNMWSVCRQISKILDSEHVDVLDNYDRSIYSLARIMCIWHRLPLLMTKCGGPRPRRYYPRAENLIVYSDEDLGYFERSKHYRHSQIHLIPNRVSLPDSDFAAVSILQKQLNREKKTFLRISRIASDYASSFIQDANLIQRLNSEGYPCQLVIIGAVEDENVLSSVRNRLGDDLFAFTSREYISDAKKLIDLGDFVIGTGRAFMEAAARGRILLTPLSEGKYPLIITNDNFHMAFQTNFSPRNKIRFYDEESNYQTIVRAMRDKDFSERLREEARSYFRNYFDINRVLHAYEGIIENARYLNRRNSLDLFLSTGETIYSFFLAWHKLRFKNSKPK